MPSEDTLISPSPIEAIEELPQITATYNDLQEAKAVEALAEPASPQYRYNVDDLPKPPLLNRAQRRSLRKYINHKAALQARHVLAKRRKMMAKAEKQAKALAKQAKYAAKQAMMDALKVLAKEEGVAIRRRRNGRIIVKLSTGIWKVAQLNAITERITQLAPESRITYELSSDVAICGEPHSETLLTREFIA